MHVSDLADALLALAGIAHAGPLHLAGADGVSRYELACLVAAANGRETGHLRTTTSAGVAPERPRDCRLDCSRAAALLGGPLPGVGRCSGRGLPPGIGDSPRVPRYDGSQVGRSLRMAAGRRSCCGRAVVGYRCVGRALPATVAVTRKPIVSLAAGGGRVAYRTHFTDQSGGVCNSVHVLSLSGGNESVPSAAHTPTTMATAWRSGHTRSSTTRSRSSR